MSCTKIDPVKQGHKTNKWPVRRKTWRKESERGKRERERERQRERERKREREAQHRRRNLLHKKGSFSGFGRFSSLPFEASLQFLSRLTTRFNLIPTCLENSVSEILDLFFRLHTLTTDLARLEPANFVLLRVVGSIPVAGKGFEIQVNESFCFHLLILCLYYKKL